MRRKQRFQRQMAVALGYHEDRNAAPHVVAKGTGRVAMRILEIAREQDIPVREDPDLVQALGALDLGQVIPSELYPAVAEVLAYIYRMNGRAEGFRR